MKKDRIEEAVRQILYAIGENLEREGLKETPRRVADMYEELIRTEDKPPDIKTFTNPGWDEIIAKSNIPYFSLCEHHLVLFRGLVHIAYLPGEKIVGVSKLARVVDYFSKRLQLQERLTHQIGKYLNEELEPRGMMIIIEGEHFCEQIRGPKTSGEFRTSAIYGDFRKDKALREEALKILLGRRI